MKRIILTFTLCLAASSLNLRAADNDTTVCFAVNPPMTCANCENKIKNNLRFEKGVKEIDASAEDAIIKVKFDKKKTSVEKLNKAFKKIGYESQTVNNKPSCNKGNGQCKKSESSCCSKKGSCHKSKSDCCKAKGHDNNNNNCCKK